MNVSGVLRYTALVLSALAAVGGILVIAGLLVPRYFPEQYRIVVGVLILLYGVYRFVINYFRNPGVNRDVSD